MRVFCVQFLLHWCNISSAYLSFLEHSFLFSQAGDEIELKLRYLAVLGIVTVQPQLHLKDPALAGEAVQVTCTPFLQSLTNTRYLIAWEYFFKLFCSVADPDPSGSVFNLPFRIRNTDPDPQHCILPYCQCCGAGYFWPRDWPAPASVNFCSLMYMEITVPVPILKKSMVPLSWQCRLLKGSCFEKCSKLVRNPNFGKVSTSCTGAGTWSKTWYPIRCWSAKFIHKYLVHSFENLICIFAVYTLEIKLLHRIFV